ncbi:MAG TPA: type II secretion system protein GspG [Pyrinomonadaceae bacterium]|nr:type II secretion system protein GspG [Pyrinomonadaceae bacterium]
MTTQTRLTSFTLSVLALLCVFAIVNVGAGAAEKKGIKRDDARKLIAAVSILELNKGVVTVKEISPPGATVTVLAGVKLAFRFVRDESGAWRVSDVRTGDRQWEPFDLLARVLGGEQIAAVRAELDAFAAELDALAAATSKKDKAASAEQSQTAKDKSQTDKDNDSEPPKELKRGVLSVKNPEAALAPLGSSAVVEIEVETSVDFVRDARGRWQVQRVRLGSDGRGFEAFDTFERALNAEKLARARADLETLAAALEEYRRARGFYVVADSASALVDHLNPRHTHAYIRFDPWHRPYEYEGTRERFTLRSNGADGKANTADDVMIGK